MGRRKIEIRAIKDDRNRSVTFLKRKGGLFKKAHELSVLCSVDVAVIIFGHNKKLYEFSSGDIQETLRRYSYYGPPHEHKGPSDFKNKGGDDDDDEEDDGDDGSQKREDSLPPQHQPQHQQPQHLMPPHMQHHNSFQHVRQPAASASPPMPNGMFQQRHSTPQPPNMLSRSNSRNEIRRSTSSIMPMQQPQPVPPPQNGFAYHPNPSIYNPHASAQAAVPPQPSPQPQFQHFQPQQQQPQQPQQQQQQQNQMHMHQQYLQDQRRQSQPPPPVTNSLQPPPQPAPRSSPQPEQHSLRPPSPPDRKHSTSKSQSIFTPIDEGGSMLARVFFGTDPPPKRDEKRQSPPEIRPPPRAVSQPTSQLSRAPTTQPARSTTTTSAPIEFPAPKRSDTNGSKSGSSRPKLNLQIPSESEENESGSGSPRGASDGRSANPDRGAHNGIVLPPPSPSASALLSAGVSGPPNPFARPPPPTSQQNTNAYTENRNGNNNHDTPVSALPSRYMEQSLIASPGGLFSDWDNWGRNNLGSAVLPSPLTFPTPSGERPPNFFGKSEGGGNEEKRKAEEVAVGDAKRVKT